MADSLPDGDDLHVAIDRELLSLREFVGDNILASLSQAQLHRPLAISLHSMCTDLASCTTLILAYGEASHLLLVIYSYS